MAVDFETLNVVQEVLRGFVVVLTAEHVERLPQIARGLQAFADEKAKDQRARAMLRDLAEGLEILSSGVRRKQ
jgi:hypothetical protein